MICRHRKHCELAYSDGPRPMRIRMKAFNVPHLFIGLAMLAAAALALVLMPRAQLDDKGPGIDLEAMIPTAFGEWTLDGTIAPLIVSPEVEAQIDRLYKQTLTRTYVNDRGQRIMLSIAYGGHQRGLMQVHLPEVCYVAQGFQIGSVSKDLIDVSGASLPVMKLVATQGQRIEPITYWAMVGDSVVRGGVERSLARVKYGLTGKIPTGMLIRVSTISANESESYRTEEDFVRAMLRAVPVDARRHLTGAVQS